MSFVKKTAESVSLGHPDKIADFISSYILDRVLEFDSFARYAVEVMIKNNTVVLGGEVCANTKLTYINDWIVSALTEIGYSKKYEKTWGENAIEISKLKIINLIGLQSNEISTGVKKDGWGDQGVFVGWACKGLNNISKEQYLAKRLNWTLYNKALKSDNLGLDIKTQITLNEVGKVNTVIVAIPMLKKENLNELIKTTLDEEVPNIIVNGTGIYKLHSSVADCGITGRKLASDFYELSCPIGGGSPWTKDPTKADLTLNLYARKLAKEKLEDNDECFVYLSSCIGQSTLPSSSYKIIKNDMEKFAEFEVGKTPNMIIDELGLRKPVYAALCKKAVKGPLEID